MNLLALYLSCLLAVLSSGPHYAAAQVVLTGAGTFPSILVQNLLLSFLSVDDGTLLNYVQQPISTAFPRFLNDTTDFSISPQLIPLANHTQNACCDCDDIRAMPVAVEGLALVHSIGGWNNSVYSVTLTRAQLVQIYLGTITNWRNISTSLPEAQIAVAYQSCTGSDIFTTALAAMNSSWTTVCSTAATSPFPVGQSTNSDEDILDYVKTTPNAIGYVSYSSLLLSIEADVYPQQLIRMVNKAGKTVLPGHRSFSFAAADFTNSINNDNQGVWANLVDAPGPISWPLAYFDYATLRSKSTNCAKADKLFKFFSFVISSREIRQTTLEPYGIANLPESIVEFCLQLLNTFSCCTKLSTTVVTTQGTQFGHNTFEDLAFTYFSGQLQLNDSATSSQAALNAVSLGSIDAALSISPPTSAPNLIPLRLFVSPVVCVANINGFGSGDSLTMERSTLAQIFDGKITSWSDTTIVNQNTKYQSNLQSTGAISLQAFADVDTRSIAAQAFSAFYAPFSGNSLPNASLTTNVGLVTSVQDIPGAIACVHYSPALPFTASASIIGLRNKAGTIIAVPSSDNVLSAANDSGTLPIDGSGILSWPICAYNYLVLNNNGKCTQVTALAKFALWVYTSNDASTYLMQDGGSLASSPVVDTERSTLSNIMCGGKYVTSNTSVIHGAGATFPLLVYQSWPIFYENLPDPAGENYDVTVSYSSVGSQVGEDLVHNGTIEFGATDVPLPFISANFTRIPTLAGALALVYNLGDTTPSQLVLSRDVLVQIYSGKVTMWNDNKIQSLNPTITLPAKAIILAYRSEQSGSTYMMKQALQSFATASNPWGYVVSTDTTWPVKSDLYGKESFDIAIAVETRDYSLGYVEASYANFTNLPICTIINKANNPTLPTIASIASAMNDFNITDNINVVKSIVDGPGAQSYPLAAYTFVELPSAWVGTVDDPRCTDAIRLLSFIYWGMTDPAPRSRMESLGFVPLSTISVELVGDVMRKVTCNGKPLELSFDRGCDGIVGSGKRNDACGVCGGNNSTCCFGTADQIAANCFKCDYAIDIHYLPNNYKCDGFLDCDGGEDDINCTVSILKTSIVLSVIAGICIILCFAVGVDLFINRGERVFRESNVFFMMMILSGCIIGFATVFVLSQLSKLNDFVCGVQYWFFGIAFVLTFGSMIAKTYQVYMLHRQHSGDLSAYTNQAIVRYVAAAMFIMLAILLIWTAFDRPRPQLRHNDPGDNTKQHYICGNEHFTIFAILLALYCAVILVLGIVLSFLSRDIDFEGNESRQIRKTIVSASLLAVVIFPILIALGSSFPFVRILLSNVALLLLASLIMVTYFGPKMIAFHFEEWTPSDSSAKGHQRLLGPIDI